VLATAKGDVHDIGKNIVGVVLACNNYEVVDLGVMVPAADILAAAKEHNADIIGVSGLITPSLDEMAHVATEMRRDGFTVPLLIGGATTSEVHTAVKIEPEYSHGAIHVPDASRAVGVVSRLLGDGAADYKAEISERYAKVREARANNTTSPVKPFADAQANRAPIDWQSFTPVEPTFTGTRLIDDIKLEDLVDYIDWTPFFRSWDLAGAYPRILNDEIVGETAQSLFADGQAMLATIIEEQWLTSRAVVGFWPANTNGDDITLYTDDARGAELATLHTLRQQVTHSDDRPNFALADFIAPADSGKADYIGAFTVTTGDQVAARCAAFEAEHDDYSSIMLKALADRLAEATAEYMHERVRVDLWGYQTEEFSNEDLIRERYQGIRPAPGYPACPDHTEKATIFELLDTPNVLGVHLTESFAMDPAASVSGLYFAHPESRYFGVRKVGADQLADYAARKEITFDEAARWLAPVLAP